MRDTHLDVSIIIVNYNTKELTKNCIDSILRFTREIDFEIILVDNDSTDGSKEYFRNRADITFVEANENLGFGRANNLGAALAKGEFLFLLNSDTVLIENSVRKMVSFFLDKEDKLNIGVLGCLLVDQHGEINGYGNIFPTCTDENRKNWNRIPLIRHLFSKTAGKRISDFDSEYFEIDYVIGADMLLRRTLFEKMEGFSEEFFMYYEESDLQKRIYDGGLRQYVYTGTKIIHLEEASGKSIKNYSNRKRIIAHKSRVTYLARNDRKNYKRYVCIDVLFLVLTSVNFKYSFSENLKYFKDIWKSY